MRTFLNLSNFPVLLKRPGCPLKSSDLLVYSYAVWQTKWGSAPSQAAISRATGLQPKTVSVVVGRLCDLGYWADGVPVSQAAQFFARKGGAGHWSDRVSFWSYYVPGENSPLTSPEAMIWSYLLHLSRAEHSGELSRQYVANAVGVAARTVSSAFAKLAKCQLFREADAGWAVPSSLTGRQTLWFRPKKAAITSLTTFEPDADALSAAFGSSPVPAQVTAVAPEQGYVTLADQPRTAPVPAYNPQLEDKPVRAAKLRKYLTDYFTTLDISENSYAPYISEINPDTLLPEKQWADLAKLIKDQIENSLAG